ncbi:MAG TPA: peptide-N4-asparagine amidase [Acidobacteriaceae bacterium]|nr:peptide-N4-asparagine amidase [Acidobacteriaceae bacterium]
MAKFPGNILGIGRSIVPAAVLLCASAIPMRAQVVVVPTYPQVGSSNPATAEPTVPRPTTKPCTVPLFQNLEFADFNLKSFSYTPPADCPGPWSKVVFTADFTVTAGRQYDRTAAFYLGQASIFYGTTAEPRSALSPSWHVERDVTDLTPIFKASQTGEANIGNFVGTYDGVVYNGIIYANAALEFYPANFRNPAPRTPDMVIPVNGSGGDAGTLNTTTDQITQTLNLPQNVEGAYLDIIAQSQSNDEFWYFCVPNDETGPLESCGGTAFRETEVSLDDKPAGVAPVYPWIFTGGIDPYLWEPTPGVQTLEFVPYRVNLTPFAGVLSDGNTHTVGVSVYNANSYFLATANLLVYLDHGSRKTTGGLISNTLSAAPTPSVQDNIVASGGNYTGNILTTSQRNFAISGYMQTSHGRVVTTVRENVNFSNNQTFTINSSVYVQNLDQLTTVQSTSTTQQGGLETTDVQNFRYPLTLDYSSGANANGYYATTNVNQAYQTDDAQSLGRFPLYASGVNNQVVTTDTDLFDTSGNFLGPSAGKSTGSYTWKDSFGGCYSRTITSAMQVLTAVDNGRGCHDRWHF